MEPKVYIIILNWNSWEDTIECLQSVFAMNYSNFEVIVIDNASENDSIEKLKSAFPDIKLIKNSVNNGFAGGNNIAMRLAMEHGADYIWLLNNDTEVQPDALTQCVTRAEADPRVGLVSAVVLFHEAQDVIQNCGSYVDWNNLSVCNAKDIGQGLAWEREQSSSFCLWGTALLVKRALIEAAGLLNEKLFAYWEDTDYSIRAIRAGFRNAIAPAARIYHKTPYDSSSQRKRSPHYFYYFCRNEHYFWSTFLEGDARRMALARHTAAVIDRAAYYRQTGEYDWAAACVRGLWHARQGVGGPWDRSMEMPWSLEMMVRWFPGLWSRLIRGEWRTIPGALAAKLSSCNAKG